MKSIAYLYLLLFVMGLVILPGCSNKEPILISNDDCRHLILKNGYEKLRFYFEKEYKANGKQWIVLNIVGSDISAFGTFNFPDSTTIKEFYNNAGLRGARLINPQFDVIVVDSSTCLQLINYEGIVD